MKKILFVLPFFRGGIRKIASEHLALVLKLSRKNTVLLIAFSDTQYEINLEMNDNIKIIDSDSSLLQEIHFDLVVFTRAIDFNLIKNVKTKKLILDLHFLNSVWVKKMKVDEVADGSFYEVFRDFDKDAQTRFMLSCLDRVKEEREVLSACDLIFANSQSTLEEVLRLNLKANSELAQVSSALFSGELVNNVAEGFCCLADPSDWRRGVHRIFNNKLGIKFGGLQESNRKLIVPENGIGSWLESKKDLYQVLKDTEYILFPSLYESFGLLLQECMSAGKICFVQKDNPGFDEQVKDKINGFQVDFSDKDWEANICRIIKENKSNMIKIKKEAALSSQKFSKLNRQGLIESKVFSLLE